MPHRDNITAPITLIGSHRSGTSLISDLFWRHPEFSFAGETGNLIFHTWNAGELSAGNIRPLIEGDHWLADEELFARLVRQAFLTCLPATRLRWFQKPVGIPLALSARFSDRDWPRAAEWYWKVLRHTFPQAKFFTVLRNPCDVALSMGAHWGPGPYTELGRPLSSTWDESTNAHWGYGPHTVWWSIGFMAYLLAHPASPVSYAISYEQLVESPRQTVEQLFAYLEVPFHEECMEAFEHLHAPAQDGTSVGPRNASRKAEWPSLDPSRARLQYFRAIEGAFARFQVPLEWPDAFASRLRTSAAETEDDAAEPNEWARERKRVLVQLDQQIRNLHLDYAEKLRRKDHDAYRAHNELTKWNDELQKGIAWLEKQLADQQTIIDDQKRWISELEHGKTWLEEQIKSQQVTIADQQEWIRKLIEAKDWLEAQCKALQTQTDKPGRRLDNGPSMAPRSPELPT